MSFSADGTGVVAHAGNVATRLLADQVGLTGALSTAMSRRGFTPTHFRGRVLVDVAVLIAGGGEAIADIDVLRHQWEVLGSVASAPTVWRPLDEVTPAVAKRIDKARATVRAHVWSQLPGGCLRRRRSLTPTSASWLTARKVRNGAQVATLAVAAADAQHTTVPGQDVAASIVAELAGAGVADQ